MLVRVPFPLRHFHIPDLEYDRAPPLDLETEAEKKAASLAPAAGQRLLMD